ncbi:MAG TPA: WXG100 family type VII secretion target [Micromonosporaceae bacterium]|nr:WXG100 family type VII secretion target [Micromonosporaceae bacterium]
MSTTRAQAGEMERAATSFEQVNDALDGMLRRLMAELDLLRSQWQGAGGRTFDEVRRVWADDQARMQAALAETAHALRTAGRAYATTDAGAADQLGGLRGRVTLPL